MVDAEGLRPVLPDELDTGAEMLCAVPVDSDGGGDAVCAGFFIKKNAPVPSTATAPRAPIIMPAPDFFGGACWYWVCGREAMAPVRADACVPGRTGPEGR